MNKKLILAALLATAPLVALADTTNADAKANSVATTASLASGGNVVFAPTSGDSIVKYAAASAIAPQLVAGIDTCMGSSSVGGSATTFSFSVGTTWKDADCRRIKDARELWNMGSHAAAIALLCTDDDTRYAISVSGGLPVRRADGVMVPVACPMTKDEWIAKGRPLLDPTTGQPLTAAQLNPPPSNAAVALQVQQPVVVASLESKGTATSGSSAKSAADIEAHAARIKAQMNASN